MINTKEHKGRYTSYILHQIGNIIMTIYSNKLNIYIVILIATILKGYTKKYIQKYYEYTKTNFNKCKRTEITQSIFSNHNRINIETKTRKEKF